MAALSVLGSKTSFSDEFLSNDALNRQRFFDNDMSEEGVTSHQVKGKRSSKFAVIVGPSKSDSQRFTRQPSKSGDNKNTYYYFVTYNVT